MNNCTSYFNMKTKRISSSYYKSYFSIFDILLCHIPLPQLADLTGNPDDAMALSGDYATPMIL